LKQFIRAALFLTALNFCAGNIPGLMPELSRLSGLVFFILWGVHYFPVRPWKRYGHVFTVLIIPILLIFLLSENLFLLGMCGSVFLLLHRSKNTDGHLRKELTSYLFPLFFYAIFFSLYRYSPYVWSFFQKAALLYSSSVTLTAGNEMTLGHSAAGFPVTISVLSYCLGLILWKRKIWFAGVAVVSPILANVIWLCLQEKLVQLVQVFNHALKPDPFDLQVFLLLCSLLLLIPLCRTMKWAEESHVYPAFSMKRQALPIIFVVLGMTALTFSKNGTESKGGIVFLDKGTNWSVPVYGKKYGQHSAGMFGLLPQYFQMRGYKTKVHKKELSAEILQKASMVALFNPGKKLTNTEKELLYAFIEAGGSLLVAGDHTDVSGIMGPINDVIEPFNIRLKFDTALPKNTGWVNGLEKRPHPIVKNLDEDYQSGVWVGASLEVSPPAAPVIVGKQGWADIGNYKNTKRAFLGDYKRSSSEQLGDVVLVAEATYGKGRILVFGDTSPFQNGILPLTYTFMDDIINWLMSADGARYYPLLQVVLAGLFLLAGCFFLIRHFSPQTVTLALVLIVLIPLVSVMSPLKCGEKVPGAFVKSFYRPAYFDNAHLGRFALLSSTEESLWGLSLNLFRNKIFPLFLSEITQEALANTEYYFVISPTEEFCAKEKSLLDDFMRKGGKVIWSVGWEEAKASESFLKEYGLSIDAVPLGAATVVIGKSKMQFAEAWPVTGGGDDKHVIAEKWDYPVMLFQPVGKGGLLVVGDSYFFFSKNIESYKKYNIQNIRMLKFLMDYLKKI